MVVEKNITIQINDKNSPQIMRHKKKLNEWEEFSFNDNFFDLFFSNVNVLTMKLNWRKKNSN